jgi:HK97 family phage portal protein
MVFQSYGQLESLVPPQPLWQTSTGSSTGSGALDLYGQYAQAYLMIYRTQPNVRTCVDFLARNIAQLGLGAYRRVSDTDRERLPPDHPLSILLQHPNSATTRYRLIESLMQDLGIYFNAYLLKIRGVQLGLVRLPPDQMAITGTLMPTGYVWTNTNGSRTPFPLSEVVHTGGYGLGLMGLSPLETLRRLLAEEAAASEYRQQMWTNATRVEGIIERPKDAPKWTPVQKQSWRDQWQGAYAAGGTRPGSVAILEDGMQFKQVSYNPRDLEYSAARKLSREECAAAYHIPPPMVGILEHATFSNIVEQHKSLYQDTLGPWLELIQSELERQVVPEFADTTDVYLEFNILEKLKGSFEQQAVSLQALVGRPVMTANEGRARLNLPRIDDDPSADKLAAQQGGPAGAALVTTSEDGPAVPKRAPLRLVPSGAEVQHAIAAHRERQATRLQKVPLAERPAVFRREFERWSRELATDINALVASDEATWFAELVTHETLARLEQAATDSTSATL